MRSVDDFTKPSGPPPVESFGSHSVEPEELFGGHRWYFQFPNGQEVSVVRHAGSYGWPELFEAWDYSDKEPIGWLSAEEVTEILNKAAGR